MNSKIYRAMVLLQQPMKKLIRDLSPDCIFSDMFFHWTVDLVNELKIPRLLFAEQFYNEKLVEILGIGVGVGSEVWNTSRFEITGPVIGKEKIEQTVNVLMGCSEEAEKIRGRAKEVAMKAKMAVEEGGSSYDDLTGLIEDIDCLPQISSELVDCLP